MLPNRTNNLLLTFLIDSAAKAICLSSQVQWLLKKYKIVPDPDVVTCDNMWNAWDGDSDLTFLSAWLHIRPIRHLPIRDQSQTPHILKCRHISHPRMWLALIWSRFKSQLSYEASRVTFSQTLSLSHIHLIGMLWRPKNRRHYAHRHELLGGRVVKMWKINYPVQETKCKWCFYTLISLSGLS